MYLCVSCHFCNAFYLFEKGALVCKIKFCKLPWCYFESSFTISMKSKVLPITFAVILDSGPDAVALYCSIR